MAPLYPRTSTLPGVGDCDLEAFLQRYREEVAFRVWAGVVLAACLLQCTPIFTVGRPSVASELPAELAERHVQALAQSRFYLVRQLTFLLKMTAGIAWGQHESVRAAFAMAPMPADPGTRRRA